MARKTYLHAHYRWIFSLYGYMCVHVHVSVGTCVCMHTCTYVNKSMVYSMYMSVQVRGHPWCQVSFSKHSPSAFETESLAGTSPGRGRLTGPLELRSQMCSITVNWCFWCVFWGADSCSGASMVSTFMAELWSYRLTELKTRLWN